MRIQSVLAGSALVLAMLGFTAFAADKASKQAEIQKATHEALEKFYKERPALKDEVAKAPGYAVFTTYGVSFLVGGAGGTGLAHDAHSKKDTYMSLAKATAGINAGISQSDTLIVFKNKKGFDRFVDKGWEFGGEGAIAAGAGKKSAGGGEGENVVNDAMTYSLTRNGLEVGPALAGSKFWKDKDLN